MIDSDDAPPPPDRSRISEAEAAYLWQRAAEMQAEALHRLEARARELRSASGASPAGADEEGFAVEDVREAAREAGIDPAFMDRAMAEYRHERTALATPRDRVDRLADRLLDAPAGSLSVSRVFTADGPELLRALNHLLTGPGYGLSLVDAEERDPLEGGALTFRIPSWTGMGGDNEAFAYRAAWLWVKKLLVTIRPMPGEGPPRWEVELMMPLRGGRRANAWGAAALGGVGGALGGGVGAGLGAAAASIAGWGILLPVALAGAALGVAGGGVSGLKLSRLSWRYGGKQMRELLDETLRRLHLELRTGLLPRGSRDAGEAKGVDALGRWLGSV